MLLSIVMNNEYKLYAAGTADNINRFPGRGNVMSTTFSQSTGGNGSNKSNGDDSQKLSPEEMRCRRLDRFSSPQPYGSSTASTTATTLRSSLVQTPL